MDKLNSFETKSLDKLALMLSQLNDKLISQEIDSSIVADILIKATPELIRKAFL